MSIPTKPGGASQSEARERSVEELERSLAVMRATFEATSDGVLVTDVDGSVREWNDRFAEMWGIPSESMSPKDSPLVLLQCSEKVLDPKGFLARFNDVDLATREGVAMVVELTDGRVLEHVLTAQIINGENIGLVWRFRDVTERRRSEEVRFRLAAIVESSDDAIVSKTLEGIITTWNTGAARMFGYSSEEVIGKSITILIPPDRLQEEPAILDQIRKGERVDHYETVRLRKDGTPLDISLTVSPIRDGSGRIVGVSKVARDITERKRTSEEREYLLGAERAARAEAERVNFLKDEFLATVSHELRTPLNAILGWSQILRTRRSDDADILEGLSVIERNARVQTQLIEDLLDMSRIISGKLRLDVQRVDLEDVVRAAVDSVRHSAEAKNIRVQIVLDTMGASVWGDPNRLQQCAWNLLTNAIKFTPKGGRVQVTLRRLNSDLELCVADSGQGIMPEFLPHVFERFRQADASTTRRHGGLGLGLSIVKHLVELHGGTVRAESAGVGEGSTFTIELRAMAVRTSDSQPTIEGVQGSGAAMGVMDHPSLAGITVLVVDDELDARNLLTRVLTDCGARVLSAESAADGLDIVRRELPDMIVSDIGMPGEDGYEFIRKVRALKPEEGGRTPAAALTALARFEDRTRALRAGYQSHVAKPVEPTELTAVVASLARNQR